MTHFLKLFIIPLLKKIEETLVCFLSAFMVVGIE